MDNTQRPTPTTITRDNIDQLLDSGRIEVQWQNGRWYAVRRNGRTKTWKRDPTRIAIPCKSGYRDCFTIAAHRQDVISGHLLNSPYLRVKDNRTDVGVPKVTRLTIRARQAISVRYIGPTNTKGARLVAACEAGRIFVPWDHSLNQIANYANACDKLLLRLNWEDHDYIGGFIQSGECVFVEKE